jgi:ATP-dependent DNA helicase RecG
LHDGGIYRRDLPLIPRTVIREAVVNALMHRSYRSNQPVQIIRFSNRVEIKNPGYSLKPEERFGEPGSKSRNPKIAAALHDAGLAETKGTGIRVMREKMEEANLTTPLIESDRVQDGFTLGLLVHHLLGHDDVQWLKGFKDCNLCPDDARALVIVREIRTIDNATYRSVNKVDSLTASNRLRALRDQGLLEQLGKGASTYYQGGQRLFEAQSSERKRARKQPLRPELTEALRRELESLRRELSPDLRGEIDKMGRRVSPDSLDDMICRLCGWRPLAALELALLLCKSSEHLQKRNIKKLVKSRRLGLLFPEEVNHPKQKYTPGTYYDD